MKRQPRRSWKLDRWVTENSIGGGDGEAMNCVFWVSKGDKDVKRQAGAGGRGISVRLCSHVESVVVLYRWRCVV